MVHPAFLILLVLTEVVVTIDGSGNRNDPSLKPWALSIGSYVENVVNDQAAVTDPAHAALYGSGHVGKCLNFDGHPQDPLHHELIQAQEGIEPRQCVLVSAKSHLLEFNRHSEFYGEAYPATTVYVWTDTVRCGLFSGVAQVEGPDSLAVDAAIAYLDSVPVRFLGLNLARTDMWGHTGLSCLGGDYQGYQDAGDSIFQAAVHLVRDRLWPWLQADPRYSGQVVMLLTTDHGFHAEGYGLPFQHGHGYMPDSTCADNCPGCSDLWAVLAGPGVAVGVDASATYQIGDLAPTVRFLMGFLGPYEAGEPIAEVLSATGVKAVPAARTRLCGTVYDVTGRMLRSDPAQGVYFGRSGRFLIVR